MTVSLDVLRKMALNSLASGQLSDAPTRASALMNLYRFRKALEQIADGCADPAAVARAALEPIPPPPPEQRSCQICGKPTSKNSSGYRKFCSRECESAGREKRYPVKYAAQIAERQQALKLRSQGMIFRKIAEAMNVTVGRAARLVHHAEWDIRRGRYERPQ